jgi:cytidylate kinase
MTVARQLGYDYVDRLILAEAARRLGATVEAVADKERRPLSLGERLARFMQTLLERSAAAGAGADPYFGPGIGVLLGQEYPEVAREPITSSDQLMDDRFIEATKSVILELSNDGNVVIIGRASNLILRNIPQAFHVGVVSETASRVETIAEWEMRSPDEARQIVRDHERAREAFFRKFFQASVDDPNHYHLMLNTHRMGSDAAAAIIVNAVNSLS